MEDQATNQEPAVPTPESAPAVTPAAAPPVTPAPAPVTPAPAPVTPAPVTPGASQAEWPARVADTIEDVVESVHDRLVRPLTLVARGVVFGIIIVVMALVLAVLAVVAVVRVLDVYAFGGRVWASDALLGAVLVAAGVFAWSKRGARSVEEG